MPKNKKFPFFSIFAFILLALIATLVISFIFGWNAKVNAEETNVIEYDARPIARQKVANIPDDASVVLLIDSSNSMVHSNWLRNVPQQYVDLLSKRKIHLVRFSEHPVKVTNLKETLPDGALGNGSIQNIYGALKYAKSFNPDFIILLSDHPGDDDHRYGILSDMPPIKAHCLEDDRVCGMEFEDMEEATRRN